MIDICLDGVPLCATIYVPLQPCFFSRLVEFVHNFLCLMRHHIDRPHCFSKMLMLDPFDIVSCRTCYALLALSKSMHRMGHKTHLEVWDGVQTCKGTIVACAYGLSIDDERHFTGSCWWECGRKGIYILVQNHTHLLVVDDHVRLSVYITIFIVQDTHRVLSNV